MDLEPSEASSSPLDIALEYIAGGLNVTPVLSPRAGRPKAGKAPYLENWQTLRLDAEAFKNAFRKGSNIGVVTGRTSGIVCVDIDNREGRAWYYEHEDNLGHHLVERRGDTNLHLYFKYPENREGDVPSKVRLFPGVDILADGGKQVVTWPSTHRKGGQYVIDNGLTLLDVAHEADEPPAWLLEVLDQAVAKDREKREKIGGGDARDGVAMGSVDNPTEIQRCREHLASYPPAVMRQGGDNRTYLAAQVCRRYNLSPQMAVEVLKEVYNPRCLPPWTESGLRAKVKNAYRYGKDSPGDLTAERAFRDAPPISDDDLPEEAKQPKEPKYTPKYPVVSAKTYLFRNPDMTLCAKDQIYRYVPDIACWSLIADNQFKSVLMADIERANPATHAALKMTQVSEAAQAVKRLLEGDDPDRDLQADTWLDGKQGEYLSCRNGILDIKTGEMTAHTPNWFSFTTLPFDYDAEAKCPTFDGFLRSIWDDEELIDSLRLWFGYVLISSRREQKFAVFKGKSRGGKGTLLQIAQDLVGARNVSSCEINTFGDNFGLEPLLGKRLAVFPDAEKGSTERIHVATERIKSITGNDVISINRKNMAILSTSIPIKIILSCNSMPPFVNDESALTNRMIVFPFFKSFAKQPDIHLGDKLNAELPGILNWALEGARRLLAGERLKQSTAGAQAVDEIAATLDSVVGFTREMLQFTGSSEHRVSCRNLWESYSTWCRNSNRALKSRQRFMNDLANVIQDRAERITYPDRGYQGMLLAQSDFGFDADASEEDDSDIPF